MQIIKRSTLPTLCALSLFVLAGACQAPQAITPSPSPTTSAQSPAPIQSPTPGPSTTPSLSPTPSNYPRPEPTPNIQLMTEADVLSKTELVDLDQAWSSPDGQRMVYILKRTQQVSLKQVKGAYVTKSDAWLLDRPTGQKTQLELGDSRLSDVRLDWIDNQNVIFTEYNSIQNQYQLVRLNTASKERKILASFGGPIYGDLSDEWYYFYHEKGEIEAINVTNGTRKQWPLSGLLANTHINLRALAGGKVILVDDRTRSDAICTSISGQTACIAPSPLPAFHAHLLDPMSGEIQAIPSLQGGMFNAHSLMPSFDGSYVGATTSYQEVSIVETASRSEVLHLKDAKLLGWLSPDQILVRYASRFEVYDLTQKRTLSQTPINQEDTVFSFDPVTQQALVIKNGGRFEIYNFAQPSRQGQLTSLTADLQLPLYDLYESQFKRPLFKQNRQAQKGPLQVFRLKPDAQGIDILLDLPYNAQPDFVFAPSDKQFWYPL